MRSGSTSSASRPRARTGSRRSSSASGFPYPLLSDERLELAAAMGLPTFAAAGRTLLRRLTMLVRDGMVERVWYPVFPPDRHAERVLGDLAERAAG